MKGTLRRRGSRWVGAVVVALFSIAVSAFGAGLKKESATVTIAPETLGSATAKCKDERKVVSGGFSSPIDPTDSFVAAFIRTARQAGPGRWTAIANDPGDNASELTVQAYCAKVNALGELRTRSTTTTLAPGESGSATAKCKRGTKAVSGGFLGEASPTGDPFLGTYESRKVGARRWRAAARNSSEGAQPGDLTVSVTCREGPRLKTRSATESAAGDEVTTTATCKRGTKAVSGGFSAPRNPSGGAYANVTTSQKVGRRRWEATAFNFFSSTAELSAYVYCEKSDG